MNKKVLKNEFWREKWIMLTALAFMFLFVIYTRSYMYSDNYTNSSIFTIFFIYTLPISFLIPTIIFKYLHSREKLDLINSLPVTRNEMFIYKYFIGLLYFTIPFFICVVTMLILDSVNYIIPIDFSLSFFMLILKYYLINVLVYTVAVLASVLTGMIIYSILGGVYLLVLPFVIYLSIYLVRDMYRNVITNIDMFYRIGFEKFFNIFNDISSYATLFSFEAYILQIAVILALIVTLALFSFYLYKKRETEKSTDVLVFNKSKKLITYLISVPTSLIIAIFMIEAFFYTDSILNELVTLFITLFVVTLIVEILINKGLKGIKKVKSIIQFVIVYGVLTFVIIFGALNIELFIPKMPNEYVEISYYTNVPEYDEKGNSFVKAVEIGMVFLIDEEQIEKLNVVLKDTIKNMPKHMDDKYYEKLDEYYTVRVGSMYLNDIRYEDYEKIKQFGNYTVTKEEVAYKLLEQHSDLNYSIYGIGNGTFNEEKEESNNEYLHKSVMQYKKENGIELSTYVEQYKPIDDEQLKQALMHDSQNYESEFKSFNLFQLNYLYLNDYEDGIYLTTNLNSDYKESINLLKHEMINSGNDSFNKVYEVYKLDVQQFMAIKNVITERYTGEDRVVEMPTVDDSQLYIVEIYNDYVKKMHDYNSLDEYLIEQYFNAQLVETFETKDLVNGKDDIYSYVGGDYIGKYVSFNEYATNLSEDVLNSMYLVKQNSKYYPYDTNCFVSMYYDDIVKYKSKLQ